VVWLSLLFAKFAPLTPKESSNTLSPVCFQTTNSRPKSSGIYISTKDQTILTKNSSKKPNTSDVKPRVIQEAIGRRKSAIASVRLLSGKGDITINGKSLSDHLKNAIAEKSVSRPLTVTTTTKYDVSVKVAGGGIKSQVEAISLGLARCLAEVKEGNRKLLRDANLLTRDSRERQRRMVGMGGKSRRKKQSPKR
jgi:small subunit ribosomal protein S9